MLLPSSFLRHSSRQTLVFRGSVVIRNAIGFVGVSTSSLGGRWTYLIKVCSGNAAKISIIFIIYFLALFMGVVPVSSLGDRGTPS